MLIAMLDQETGLRGFINTRRGLFLEPYVNGRTHLETAIAGARRYATQPDDRKLLTQQVAIARQWQGLAEPALAQAEAGLKAPVADALARKRVMDRFRALNAAFVADKEHDRALDRRNASIFVLIVILALGALFGVLVWLVFERPARAEAARRRRMARFGDALQVARGEAEAFDVLKRHLEGWFDDSRAVVMVRNASQNRLEPATPVDNTPVIAQALEEAAPEDCLAIRLARPHERGPDDDDSLMVCGVCGKVAEPTTCVPTVVGGEVVGSVIMKSPGPLTSERTEDFMASVRTAGPVIANLRNLALAERRAATDSLTGLANTRAAADVLKRLVAQASRSKTELTAIMFDLDHFKSVNDIHGHSKGDEVLATVAAVVKSCVRESDFLGRIGGEEFVALLPDTTREGGATLAEKLRASIEATDIPDLDRRLSASFGVASLPADAVSGDQLLRAADRALYAAKNNGRNRVEVVSSGESRSEPAEAR